MHNIWRAVVGVIAGLFVLAVGQAKESRWMWSSGTHHPYTINDQVFGAGVHVAATDHGHILTSTDGKDWQMVLEGNAFQRKVRARYLRGRFYVGGDRGELYTSPDGKQWNKNAVPNPANSDIVGFATTGALELAVTASGAVYSNNQATLSWNVLGTLPVENNEVITDLAYGNGMFVATSRSRYELPGFRSSDGITWQRIALPPAPFSVRRLTSIDFAKGVFVAAGESDRLYHSADAITWSETVFASNQAAFRWIRYVGNMFYAVGNQLSRSVDGIVWTGDSRVPANAISGSESNLVAASFGGYYTYSQDGSTWTDLYTPQSTLTRVTTAFGRFYGLSALGHLLRSNDGLEWSQVKQIDNFFPSFIFSDGVLIAPAGGEKIVVGLDADESKWQTLSLPNTGVVTAAVKFKGEYYVFGTNRNYRSADGITWTPAAVPTMDVRSAVATDSLLVVGGATGMGYSEDGVNFIHSSWQRSTQVVFYKGGFHSFNEGTVMRSTDGKAWGSNRVLIRWKQSTKYSSTYLGDAPSEYEPTPLGDYASIIEGVLYFSSNNAVMQSHDGINWAPSGAPSAAMAQTETHVTALGTNFISVVRRTAYPGKLTNISLRTNLGGAGSPLTLGTVISGGPRTALLRGVGPSLASHKVSNPADDPILQLYQGDTRIETVDDWNPAVLTSSALAPFGAFPLDALSKDAMVVKTLVPGAYTAQVYNNGPAGRNGMAEIYVDPSDTTGGQIINLSTLAQIGKPGEILIAGINIHGGKATLLFRSIGTGLSEFGVTNPIKTTQIVVFSGTTGIAHNSSWGTLQNKREVEFYHPVVGAFPLKDESTDSVLLLTLDPGNYTIQVSSPSGSVGTTLIEAYLVKP